MLITVIRDGKELSAKAQFVIQLFKLNSSNNFLNVFRKEQEQFKEKRQGNTLYLATSFSGILLYFSLMYLLKSPRDLHDGLTRRFFRKAPFPRRIRYGGFLTVLSQALYQYLARSAQTDSLMHFLKNAHSKKSFLIDEFFSLNVAKLRKLKELGPIIYVSSDLAYDFYRDNFLASKIMYKFEREAIAFLDLIVACSERDKLKYEELGARNVVYYPNLYPIDGFELCDKDQFPSITIVLRGHWGTRTTRSFEQVFEALNAMNRKIRLYMIGAKPRNLPKNVEMHYYNYVSTKLEYLRILSKSWIGINLGVHTGGTNQRKYDYAMSGLVVFSDMLGARGDLLPNEYTYIDSYDLAAKLNQFLELKKTEIEEKGLENRNHILLLAKKQKEELNKTIKAYC